MTSLVMTTPDSETSDAADDNTNEDHDVMTFVADVINKPQRPAVRWHRSGRTYAEKPEFTQAKC